MAELMKLRKRLVESVDQNVKFVKIERVGEEESLAPPEVVIYL